MEPTNILKMQPYKYQTDQINEVFKLLPIFKKVGLQLPTGGGKTVEFSFISLRFYRETGKSVLVLVDREELLFQATDAITRITGIKPHLITSNTKKYYKCPIYIGMVESVVRRLDLFDEIGLVIIDEAHVNSFNKVHSIFIDEYILGVTATPKSSVRREPFKKYYNKLITGPQISELISLGKLSSCTTKLSKEVVDTTKIGVDNKTGDFSERQMYDEYKAPKYLYNTVRQYQKYCEGEKTLIFNINVAHSIEVCELFNSFGYECRHLDGTSKDRKETIKWFRRTKNAILCNVGLYTRGFDEATILNVILNFDTLSIAKFLQCCGRGGRIIDAKFIEKFQKYYEWTLKHKYKFKIIDMGGNWRRFGEWSDDRNWQYIYDNPEIPGDGIAPVKQCPSCDGLVHAARMICNHSTEDGEPCLYEFEKKVIQETIIQDFVSVSNGVVIEEYIKSGKSKYKYFALLEMAKPIVKKLWDNRYSKNLHPTPTSKERAFIEYWKLCCEWWKKTHSRIAGNVLTIEFSPWHSDMAKKNFELLYKLQANKNKEKIKTVQLDFFDHPIFRRSLK